MPGSSIAHLIKSVLRLFLRYFGRISTEKTVFVDWKLLLNALYTCFPQREYVPFIIRSLVFDTFGALILNYKTLIVFDHLYPGGLFQLGFIIYWERLCA